MFPHLAGVAIERVERPPGAVEIWGRVAAETGRCRSCGAVASRVHSRYRRRLDDVPVAGQPVVIHLTVRRFFCPAADCSRQTFAEQLPDLTWRYGRRTPVARQMLETIGLALGGRAGARLAAAAGIAAGGRRCCAWSGRSPNRPWLRPWCWASMISHCAAAAAG